MRLGFTALVFFVVASTIRAQTPTSPGSTPAGEYVALAEAIHEAMGQWLFDPTLLRTSAYGAIRARVTEIGARARSREEFVRDFNAAWREGPFSHVQLQVARASAEQTARALDALRVGGNGARLEWRDDTAILTVDTMMGADTIEQIDAAFEEVGRRRTRGLLVDLRANGGGAFAGVSLVGHVIGAPWDAGVFVARPWTRTTNRPPTRADLADVPPWRGWSLTAFWRDVAQHALTRIRFEPIAPHYDGPVAVLVSGRTASAAEMAADALRASGRAILVGERTAGRMLSQKPFDMPHGLQLLLPIADYYSLASGRIEGNGLAPDIPVPASDALEVALRQLASK
jgi:C-terminal processing protease CtpA/Prc